MRLAAVLCLATLAACSRSNQPAGDDSDAQETPEACNGLDDDGDGAADEDFSCILGTSEACAHPSTGCAGTRSCGEGCAWSACASEAWECTPGAAPEACTAGACPGTRSCGADCAWTACEADCGEGGACCASGCADLRSDPAHCGACERACGGDSPFCAEGACCVEGCRNGSEVCDDQGFTVASPYVPMWLVCVTGEGGVGYVASNTGPACEDGVPRCRGWEENGMDAWDYLEYLAVQDCMEAGQAVPVDLSAWEGEGLWVGVHDQPEGGGHMTEVCIAEGVSP